MALTLAVQSRHLHACTLAHTICMHTKNSERLFTPLFILPARCYMQSHFLFIRDHTRRTYYTTSKSWQTSRRKKHFERKTKRKPTVNWNCACVWAVCTVVFFSTHACVCFSWMKVVGCYLPFSWLITLNGEKKKQQNVKVKTNRPAKTHPYTSECKAKHDQFQCVAHIH